MDLRMDEELKEEEIESIGINSSQRNLAAINVDDTANCPKCSTLIIRSRNKINLLECDICRLFLCFNCGKQIGDFTDSKQIKESQYEKAKDHYEHAYCHYKENS